MLNDIIENYQYLLELGPGSRADMMLEVPEDALAALVKAAKLLCQVHKEADEGLLDGVDLKWLCNVDELVLGIEEETQQ